MELGKRNGEFTSPDSFLASYLIISGFSPELVFNKGRVLFTFTASPELHDAIDRYATGAQVGAAQYATVIRGLKSRLYSMKKENGNGKA